MAPWRQKKKERKPDHLYPLSLHSLATHKAFNLIFVDLYLTPALFSIAISNLQYTVFFCVLVLFSTLLWCCHGIIDYFFRTFFFLLLLLLFNVYKPRLKAIGLLNHKQRFKKIQKRPNHATQFSSSSRSGSGSSVQMFSWVHCIKTYERKAKKMKIKTTTPTEI